MVDNANYIQTNNNRRRRQPHILTKVVDPNGDKSSLWHMLFVGMVFLELVDILIFFVTLNTQILFKIFFFNAISVLTMIMFLIIPCIWALIGFNQTRLNYNVRKYRFKWGLKHGREHISKYSKGATEDAIRGFTGIISYDAKTGLSEYQVNESPAWVLEKHPYEGNRGFDLIVIPEIVEEDEVITANLHAAAKSLPAGTLKKTTMITGQSFSYIMDDVKEQLEDKNISPVRYSALMSVWDQYKDRASTNEPIFLIHIGLPYRYNKEDSLKIMQEIRDGYEASLNQRGFATVLIKDPEDWVMIITGMLTGKMFFRGGMVENN